jgi:hypothetical protein
VAVDVNGQATASPTVFFDVADAASKRSPLVVLTAPTALSTVNADTPIIVAADAVADRPATISKVEFFNGSTLIGTATAPPYQVSWSNALPGTAMLTARATDSTAPAVNSSAGSSAIFITVASNNPRPVVSLTAPAPGAQFAAPASINLTATASDPGGSIAKVEFFAGTTLVGTDTTAPYAVTWASVPAGTYSLTARATDNGGASTVSSPISVTVAANIPPTVALTAPINGSSFAFGTPMTLSATATDAESGSPAKVEFFAGATLLATVTSAPYSFNWTNPPAGTHSITARATDAHGAAATTPPAIVSVTANAVPTVALVLPRPYQRFVTGTPVKFFATAGDSDGSIARVDFLSNGVLVGTATTAPYEFVWANAPTGSYSATARAVDNRGSIVTSTTTTFSVAPLSVTITTPLNNAALPADFVFVRGTFIAPANSSVLVNGVPARVFGNQFFANHVPLTEGSNVIEARIVTPDDQQLSTTRTVTRTGSAPLRIYLDPDEGVLPMTTAILIENRAGLTIVSAAFENLGTVVLDATGAGQEFLGTLQVATAGIYAPTIVVTDSTGAVHRQTIGLLAASRASIEQAFTPLWTAYTALLSAGRVDLALAGLPSATAERYRPILEPMAPHLRQIIATWLAPRSGRLTNDVGEFTISRVIDGQKRLFFVYFVKDDRGIWQLDSM